MVAHHFGHLGLVEKFQNGQRIFPGGPQQVPVLRQRKGGVALKEITGQGADLLIDILVVNSWGVSITSSPQDTRFSSTFLQSSRSLFGKEA